MQVAIRRIDASLALPTYASSGAAAFDLFCRLDVTIGPGEVARLPANVIVAVPEGFVLVIALRSSTPQRKHLLSPHGVGIIDQDYHGPDDEVAVLVYNFGATPTTVSRGERIAQALFLPLERGDWSERLPEHPSRGGFGSTG